MKKKYCIIISMIIMMIAVCLMGACSATSNPAKPTTKPSQQEEPEKYTVLYYAGEGGSIEGEWAQKVESGKDCSTITAVAKRDYVFVGWSDGVETETRTDTNITQNLTVTAMFEYHVATVELNYYAGEHGTVVGDVHQIVPYEHRDATYVCAVPDEGYRFQIWSDGVTTDSRVDGSDGKNVEVTAYFERITFEITYLTDGNGWIDGEATQTVYYGEDGKAVTAVPNEGYRFIGWSDRRKEAERSEYGIYWDYQCTAQFEKIINKYHYNLADCYPYRSMELEYGEIEDYPFYVPSPREHYTFDGWMLGEMKVTDEVGKLIVGNEFFDSEERELHAKWIADAKYTYKVLIVYVTEVSGTFQIDSEENGGILKIDYKMTDEERAICHMTTKQVEKYFEYALDGLVDFQIDEYYTQVPLTRSDILGYAGGYYLFANKIPEVSELLDDYQHVAVSLSFFNYDTVYEDVNRYWNLMNDFAGISTVKYSCIARDHGLNVLAEYHITSEYFTDETNWNYNSPSRLTRNIMIAYIIETYIHEFIHM